MKKLLIGLILLPVVLIAFVAVFVATLDPNHYREPLTKALSEQTGRRIELNGPITIGLSWHGIRLSVSDVVVGNPAWASRPEMAKIGSFEMGLALPPLLRKRVVVTGVTLAKSDVLLESASGDRHNWDIKFSNAQGGGAGGTDSPAIGGGSGAKSAAPIAWQVNHLAVMDSVFGIRDVSGKVTRLEVGSLSVAPGSGGVAVNFAGKLNGETLRISASTDGSDLFGKAMRPLAFDLDYASYALKAGGKIGLDAKKADFESYSFKSGGSEVHGKLSAEWGGAQPKIVATVLSSHVAPSDFQGAKADSGAAVDSGGQNGAALAPAPAQADVSGRVLSDAPLGFSALRQIEADVDVDIGDLLLGSMAMTQVKAKVAVHDGQMNIAPLTAVVGGGSLNGQVQVNAATSPAKLGTTLIFKNVELADMLKFHGAESLIQAKAAVDINLTSFGESVRALAGNLSGTVSVISAGGDVVSRSQETVLSGLAKLLAPGTSGNAAMNCLVARFTAAEGVVRDNGILVDTVATTVAGSGGVDLRNETLNFTFRAKPKGVNVGGMLPPVQIGGSLAKPSYGVHAESVIRNVAGLLMGNGAGLNDPIPDVVVQAGQNACLAALNNPQARKTTPEGGAVQDLAGKANKAAQDIGGKLMKGLFGK
ncbi:MAG: AsmA family protein [Bdellovibrionales bacterium]